MSTPLLGPDGKELNVKPRAMPTRQEKFNMVLMMFTLMTKAERQILVKQLRPLRRKLDVMYPNGMSEDAIKTDMANAAQSVADEIDDMPEPPTAEEEELDNAIAELSEQENNAVEENPEIGAEQDISDEPETNEGC